MFSRSNQYVINSQQHRIVFIYIKPNTRVLNRTSGKGVLVLLQKRGKPMTFGEFTSESLTLNTRNYTVRSLIVLTMIAPKVDEYLSASQSLPTSSSLAVCETATSLEPRL